MTPLYVTQPSLATLERYSELLGGVWERGILTHNGPLVQRLEKELQARLGVRHLATVTNGTIALQLAIRALGLKGEIITTPFTWVATVSAILWEGCRPVFADIDPETLNIDPECIEEKITRDTVAILPVHVYGNPCDTVTIGDIARRHGLKVIYDGAHAFDVRYRGAPVVEEGDVTALSFHATKLFNTGEGGACVSTDPELDERIRRLRFFGHNTKKDVVEVGLNGKMTEIHAALGLVNLEIADAVAAKRHHDAGQYRALFRGHPDLRFQKHDPEAYNDSYFPLIFRDEEQLLRVERALNDEQIFPRRYFYPTVNTLNAILPYVAMPIAEDISRRICCLPLYRNLTQEDITRIADIVLEHL